MYSHLAIIVLMCFTALNQENDKLHERIRQLSKMKQPPLVPELGRNANPQVCVIH